MGSFVRPSGGSAEFSKTQQRFNKSPVKNTIKNIRRKFSKNVKQTDPKNLKETSIKATINENQIDSCASTECGNISTEHSASSSENENSLKLPNQEENSKYVVKALEMIQSTIAEANDLEKLIKMSEKFSSDGIYIRDVMLRLVVELNKIETMSNKEVIQKKNEAAQFLQEKMKQLVRYSEEAQRKMFREKKDVANQSYPKCDSDKYCKTEKVTEKEILSIITEEVEKELTSQALEVFKVKTDNDSKQHFKLYRNLPGYDQYVPKEELHLCDNSAQVDETASEGNLRMTQMKASLPSCFVLLPDMGNTKTPLSSSSAVDADHSNSSFEIIQQPCSSSYILDDGQTNLSLKRLVGPYIVINHDISKSLVASRAASIQNRLAESGRYENRTFSKDDISITEETTSIQRNIHTVSITPVHSTYNIRRLFGGETLKSRLLAIILIALLMQIPLLMITCALWC